MNARCKVLPPRTWSVVPVATILPWSMIDTWSQTCSTSSMTWLENSTVEPDPVKRAQQPADHVSGDRVDAFQRLVQEQHRWVVDQRAPERGLLPHAGGVVGDQPLGIFCQVQHVQQLRRP